MRSDISKDLKVAMMENIDKHGDLIKQAEKKELMKVFTNNVLTEFRILNWLQRFR